MRSKPWEECRDEQDEETEKGQDGQKARGARERLVVTIGSEQMGRRSSAAAEAKMAKGIRQVNTVSDGNKDKAVSACQG